MEDNRDIWIKLVLARTSHPHAGTAIQIAKWADEMLRELRIRDYTKAFDRPTDRVSK